MRVLSVTAGAVLIGTASAFAAPECPGDANGDLLVGFDDVVAVLSDWGPCPGCPTDHDEDGDVGFDDLVTTLSNWGSCLFEYGPVREDAEAEQIGLEMIGTIGPLLLPDATYDRIVRDQAAIRAAYPELETAIHDLAWAPTQLIVQKLDGQPTEDYDCLNTFMQVVDETNFAFDFYLLTFPGKLNVVRLGLQYAALPNVGFAEPNGLVGTDDDWAPSLTITPGVWQWFIDDGFHDCFDGCDCHRYWTIEVDGDGTVTLIDYEEVGLSWCDFSGGE